MTSHAEFNILDLGVLKTLKLLCNELLNTLFNVSRNTASTERLKVLPEYGGAN